MHAGWLNDNCNRAYPFLTGSVDVQRAGPLTLFGLPDDIVADAGFTMRCNAHFDSAVNTVYLESLSRSGSTFTFVFGSDAPELYGVPLVFTRQVSDGDYAVSRSSSGDFGTSESSESAAGRRCGEPLWTGFLVTGKMAALELLLPADGTINGVSGAAVLEPATVRNLSHSYVSKLALANDDRTRATAPPGCPAVTFPYRTGGLYVNSRCVLGDVVLAAGYNCTLRQDDHANAIAISAAVGAGAGLPCNEVALFNGETPPAGSTLLEGGPQCNEAIRSVNGVGGPILNLTAGSGVTITSLPGQSTLVVSINMSGLALCFDSMLRSSQSC